MEEVGGQKSGSPSPLVGSVGRISGRESIASLASSTDTSCLTHPDEDIERLLQLSEKKTSSLTPLGVSLALGLLIGVSLPLVYSCWSKCTLGLVVE